MGLGVIGVGVPLHLCCVFGRHIVFTKLISRGTVIVGNEVKTCTGKKECSDICPASKCIKDFETLDGATECSTTESKETMVVGISDAYCRHLCPCPTNYHARCLCCKNRHFLHNRCTYQCRRYCKASEENQGNGKGCWTQDRV